MNAVMHARPSSAARTRLKAAAIMLYLAAAGAVFFGLLYLVTPRIMPYHERFLGMQYENLSPQTASLLLGFMKIMGGTYLGLGVGVAWLVWRYLSRGDTGIRWVIGTMSLLALIPNLVVTLSVGLYTPWWAVAIMILLVIFGVLLAASDVPRK